MNSKIKSRLLNHSDNKQNTLDIYIGTLKNKVIFNKNLDPVYFKAFFEKIQLKNYKFTKFNRTIYNHVNDYLILENKQYISKTNKLPIVFDEKAFVFYFKEEKHYTEFSNKKTYNEIHQKIDSFQVNDEINILFINNNQIKINVSLNHNLDHTIPILEKLLDELN